MPCYRHSCPLALLGIASILLLEQTDALSATAPKRALSFGISEIEPTNDGKSIKITFEDSPDTSYLFHSLWLRDACRDENHVVGGGVGERILGATPLLTCNIKELKATGAVVFNNDSNASSEDDMKVEITWNDASSTPTSTFDISFLREYADVAAQRITEGEQSQMPRTNEQENEMSWLKPYTGFINAPAPSNSMLWSRETADFPRFQHDEVLSNPQENLKLLQDLMQKGVVLVDGMPPPSEDDSGSALKNFIERSMGGLQKDPTRDEPNWQITKKVGATSISYDHDKRLNSHTDSSIPPHGLPGLVLSMCYVNGKGANTLADGFAVAQRMKETDPEAFQLLVDYGYDAERDFVGSRVDSEQNHYKSLKVLRNNRIFEVDNDGNLSKIMYNEVFRLPLTLPYDVFPKWYAAFDKFVSLIHSEEFEITVPMQAGTLLLMNNWRVLHGRAGGMATYDRKVVGGTILRESFFSRAHDLVDETAGYKVPCAWMNQPE